MFTNLDKQKHIRIFTLEDYFNENGEPFTEQIRKMFPAEKDLPPVTREITMIAPLKMKIPAFFSAATCLTPYASRLRFRYTFDAGDSACLLQLYLVARQAGGKSFARMIYNVVLERIIRRDNEQRAIEKEYNEEKARSRKTDKLPKPPKTIVMLLPVSTSIAKLVQRCDAPVRHYGQKIILLMFSEELALSIESSKRSYANLQSILRTAYDLDSLYGVDYLSDSSYSAVVDILLSTFFCTTPNTLHEYFGKRALEGGNLTRSVLIDLDTQLGDEPPVFKELTAKQLERISEITDKMFDTIFNADGSIKPTIQVDMKWLNADVKRWCSAKNTEAVKSGSISLGTFFKRASTSAFRIAALSQYLYSLEGKTCRQQVRKIYYACAEVILYYMLKFFDEEFEQLHSTSANTGKTRKSLFNAMPETFTKDMLLQKMQELGKRSPANVIISQWKNFGWIVDTEKDSYKKTGKK